MIDYLSKLDRNTQVLACEPYGQYLMPVKMESNNTFEKWHHIMSKDKILLPFVSMCGEYEVKE